MRGPASALTSERPLILGSRSPRRREILETLRVPHVVLAAEVDETPAQGEGPEAYLVRIVRAKLAAVEAALPAELRARRGGILVADTSVILRDPALGEVVLGKPEGTALAAHMILRLAGATHEVHTRFAVARPGGALHEETVRTRVTFRPLRPEQASAYAETGEGLDKAGGYAVQGMGAAFVSRIDGSYSNVVGLPACELCVALEKLGLL